MANSFYDVLLVDHNATLDEIKLAFKRRALQVHPDKGGSKEAFHLVYQALETLADPEARKTYDHSLSSQPVHPRQAAPSGRRSSAKKRCHKAAKPTRPPAGTAAPRGSCNFGQVQKLLVKIHHLLKELPRNLRSTVLSRDFSQKQRLMLEKWMVETGPPRAFPGLQPPNLAKEQFPQQMEQKEAIADRDEKDVMEELAMLWHCFPIHPASLRR